MILNGNNSVNLDNLKSNYKKFTKFEKKALTDALNSANYETNAPIGSVEHTHQMRMAIDDMIDSAQKKSNNRHTVPLSKLRDELDKILKTDKGYKAIDNEYEYAMRVKNSYDSGLSASKKSPKISFRNEDERKAWLSGVNDSMKNTIGNSDTNYAKNVANNLSVIKRGATADEFNKIKQSANAVNKEYSRASSLDKIVNKENYAENRPFWREILESVGSAVGSTLTAGEKALFGLSDVNTARRILNGTADGNIARIVNKTINNSIPSSSSILAERLLSNN
ncbi:MAG: hypothetical protein KBT03_13745 [Bacteroidales bacterium]|nr:hypothetical protein [Candidatus Scybalousia scybalohippi]